MQPSSKPTRTNYKAGKQLPVVSEDEERPEHCALRRPVDGPERPGVERRRRHGQPRHHGHVPCHVRQRPQGALAPAVGRHGGADVADAEGRRLAGVEDQAAVLGGLGGGLLLLPLLLLLMPHNFILRVRRRCCLQLRRRRRLLMHYSIDGGGRRACRRRIDGQRRESN